MTNYDSPAGASLQGTSILFNTLSGGSSASTLVLSEHKVGIGTETPNEKLTVVGNISAVGTGTHVFESNTNKDTLRITQTGTGNSLVVEDFTNPDSSPFVINQYGTVVIGASAARAALPFPRGLEYARNSSSSGRLEFRNHHPTTAGSHLEFLKYRNNNQNDFTTNYGISANDVFAQF